MSQRVMIAMAIACNPKLLIADEPTTALDVTIQAQILDLLLRLQRETGMGLVLITHDMGVVAETARARRRCNMPARRSRSRTVTRPVRRPASSLHRGAARRAAGARHTAAACPRSRASCPASSTGRRAACSRRAAPSPPNSAAPVAAASRQRRSSAMRCAIYPLVDGVPLGHPGREAAA